MPQDERSTSAIGVTDHIGHNTIRTLSGELTESNATRPVGLDLSHPSITHDLTLTASHASLAQDGLGAADSGGPRDCNCARIPSPPPSPPSPSRVEGLDSEPRADIFSHEQSRSLYIEMLAGNEPPEELPEGLRCLCIADSGCGTGMGNDVETQFEPGTSYTSRTQLSSAGGPLTTNLKAHMKYPVSTNRGLGFWRENDAIVNRLCPYVLLAVGLVSSPLAGKARGRGHSLPISGDRHAARGRLRDSRWLAARANRACVGQ